MQLFIVAVGKARRSVEHRLAEDWLGRLPNGGDILEIESKLPANAKRKAFRYAPCRPNYSGKANIRQRCMRGCDRPAQRWVNTAQ